MKLRFLTIIPKFQYFFLIYYKIILNLHKFSGVLGFWGGSNYNILGPAGALVNILNSLSFEYGPEILPYIAIGSGIIFMAVYFLKIE